MTKVRSATLAATTSALALATGVVSAQSSDATAGNESAALQVEEIVVTGSRIARTGYDMPTPVAITGAEAIQKSGLNDLYDVLEQTPQFGVGKSSGNDGTAGFTGDVGASFVDLRQLGASRTLVLVNGRRRVSGSTTISAVDVATIPANMIERTEVVTGGAAAIYGADAVTGVVNLILRDDVEGLELNARQGVSDYGDAASYSVGGLYGGSMGERGRFSVGLTYNHDPQLIAPDRPFSSGGFYPFANPLNTSSTDGIPDTTDVPWRLPAVLPGGGFAVNGVRYTYDGALRPVATGPYVYGFDAGVTSGGEGSNFHSQDALYREERSTGAALAHFSYDLTDEITLTSDLHFARTGSRAHLQPSQTDIFYLITRDNAYLPADVAALMDANGLTSLFVNRNNVDHGERVRDMTRTTYTGVVGLEGTVTEGIKWEAFAQFGRYEVRDTTENEHIRSRVMEAADVVNGPDGPMCRDAAARAAGCSPLRIFGSNVADRAALNYTNYRPLTEAVNEQTLTGAQIFGDLFDLPAGPASFAAGVEYREESLDVDADPLAEQGLLGNYNTQSISGDFDVTEFFGELVVPVLKDLPWVHHLAVDGAGRLSDHSISGSSTTWKAGLVYAPVSNVTLRASRARSVRAPNINEFFAPAVMRPGGIGATSVDPCDVTRRNESPNRDANCTAAGFPDGTARPSGPIPYTSGNTDLEPETSNSWTAGVVLQPSVIAGLNVSVDYYQIKIADAIAAPSVDIIVRGCYDGPALDPTYCDLIQRNAGGPSIDFYNTKLLNIAALKTNGIDFAADYRTAAGSIGGQPLTLSISLSGSHTLKYDTVVSADTGLGAIENAGNLFPDFRANLSAGAALGALKANWTMRYIGAFDASNGISKEYFEHPHVTSRLYHDVFANYDLTERFNIGFGINNLFDLKPPKASLTNMGGAVTGEVTNFYYDVVGRYFFLTAGFKL